ncbi:MAG TPA: hypothetical protein VFN91_09085 [Myxococcaceae bacterium]|nr:hypothetical protein [Myxococcaceae bacterium]
MRLGPALGILIGLVGCSNERCLELLTDGIQPSATTWISAAGTREGDSRASLWVGSRGVLAAGTHAASCTNPGGDETLNLVVWFDDSAQSPFDTYCKDLVENPATPCGPQPGQPFGEKSFRFAGAGLTTVTVTIHQP